MEGFGSAKVVQSAENAIQRRESLHWFRKMHRKEAAFLADSRNLTNYEYATTLGCVISHLF